MSVLVENYLRCGTKNMTFDVTQEFFVGTQYD